MSEMLNEVMRKALREPFPAKEISKLPGTAKRPALDYVSHAAVTNRLNQAAPDWTYEVERVEVRGNIARDNDGSHFVTDPAGLPHVVAVFGTMTIGGVTRQEVGEVDSFSTYGLELKNAISDFIRRAAMRFGVALDLWAKEELSSGPGASSSDTTATPLGGSELAGAGEPKESPLPTSASVPSVEEPEITGRAAGDRGDTGSIPVGAAGSSTSPSTSEVGEGEAPSSGVATHEQRTRLLAIYKKPSAAKAKAVELFGYAKPADVLISDLTSAEVEALILEAAS